MIAIRSITYSSWRDITRRKHATDDPGAGRARDNLNIVSGALSGDLELETDCNDIIMQTSCSSHHTSASLLETCLGRGRLCVDDELNCLKHALICIT